MPTSVLRRYTPPTCTLEIAATGSALSRWTDRAVLKNLRFQLSLDDPKLPEEKQVLLRGDRTQLEALWGAVTTHVQSQLSQPPELYSASSALGTSASGTSPLETSPLGTSAVGNGNVVPLQSPAVSEGLAGETEGTAGETLGESLGEGLGEGLGESLGESLAAKTGIRLQPRGLVSHDLHLGTLATEQSGAIVPLSTLQLFDLANVLDEYHAEALTLPALGRSAWSKSPSRWGSVAAVALLAIGATAALTKFVTDVSNPNVQVASAPTSESSALSADQAGKSSVRLPSPPGLEPLPPALKLQPLPPPPPVGATKPTAPVPTQTVPVPQGATSPTAIVPTQPGENSAGQVAVLPQPTLVPGNPSVFPAPSAADRAAAGIPSNPDNPDITALSRAQQPQTLRPDPGAAGSAASSAATSAISSPSSSTAFDAIPQVAEVRSYFQQKWQPPQELSQTLEYSLVLNANGSIQRIVPLGVAAETFLDRTNMPLMNEPFVSPIANGGNPQIRLVLGQDGRVQTFLERK